MAEFAAYVAATAADMPLLGLFTTRPEVFARPASHWAALAAAQSDTGVTRVDLHPLSPPETERLVAALLRGDDTAKRAAIVHRCGGNPLYAEELVRLQSHPPGASDDVRSPPAGADGPEIPATLHSLIAARLDSLAPPLKAALADAAVIGEVFDTDTLSLVGGATVPLDDLISALETRDFVRRLPAQGVSSAGRYTFQHAVTREVAYGQLPRSARLQRHEKYGVWLLRPHERGGRVARGAPPAHRPRPGRRDRRCRSGRTSARTCPPRSHEGGGGDAGARRQRVRAPRAGRARHCDGRRPASRAAPRPARTQPAARRAAQRGGDAYSRRHWTCSAQRTRRVVPPPSSTWPTPSWSSASHAWSRCRTRRCPCSARDRRRS